MKDNYDFALISESTFASSSKMKQKIITLNGVPDMAHTCRDTKILYYKNKMYTKPFLVSGISLDWKASRLPSRTGDIVDKFIIAKSGISKPGDLRIKSLTITRIQ